MRVVMVSKALVVGAYQRKAEAIARLGVDLTVLIPPGWADRRGRRVAEMRHTDGYTLRVIPLHWNGNFHLHYYPTLRRELALLRPDIVHMDEEPYNLATWLGLRAAQAVGAKGTFFTWQNLYRHYPPPFRWFERANYRIAPAAIAGNQEAAAILRRKGYTGDLVIIPQFGVDPVHFAPHTASQPTLPQLRIGYAGGLLPEKGVDLLLRACVGLRGNWQLTIAGEGTEAVALKTLANSLGIAGHITWLGHQPSTQMADFYRALDLLVVPSRTQSNWKEQFGRVLIEAMACAVCVVGSDSGEIPHVIGDAGCVVPENDVAALRDALQSLVDDPNLRHKLGAAGRTRVLQKYTMATIAQETAVLYRRLMEDIP